MDHANYAAKAVHIEYIMIAMSQTMSNQPTDVKLRLFALKL